MNSNYRIPEQQRFSSGFRCKPGCKSTGSCPETIKNSFSVIIFSLLSRNITLQGSLLGLILRIERIVSRDCLACRNSARVPCESEIVTKYKRPCALVPTYGLKMVFSCLRLANKLKFFLARAFDARDTPIYNAVTWTTGRPTWASTL